MSSDSFNWLLVRWNSGDCDVVHLRSVVGTSDKEPQFGDVITVTRRGEPVSATLIGRAQERYMLEAGPSRRCEAGPSRRCEAGPSRRCEAGPSGRCEAGPSRRCEAGPSRRCEAGPSRRCEAGPSGRCEAGPSRRCEAGPSRRCEAGPSRRYEAGPSSSQEAGPSFKYEEEADSDTCDAIKESVKVEAGPSFKIEEAEDYSCSESSWVPSGDEDLSVDSDTETTPVKMSPQPRIITRAGRNSSKRLNLRRLNLIRLSEMAKFLEDSAKREREEEIEAKLKQRMEAYNSTLNLLDDLKWHIVKKQESKVHTHLDMLLKAAEEINRLEQSVEEHVIECRVENSEDPNEFIDTVLITNNRHNVAETNKEPENEWIPIGSGKTLIHKDKFKTVNWKSFTIATRTLLLAAFPRRILATHCLTGKSSPAFKNKPAKMILDPKVISDVIIEIMDRFNVRENVVRSVITTKCADECKMLKMRIKKMNQKNDENMPPDTNNNSDSENENHEE